MGIIGILGWLLIGFGVVAQVPQAPVEPSPWWIIDRFGRNMVTKTEIDDTNKQIRLTIEPGIWANLDYLNRYSTLQHLASSAIPYNYSMILISPRKTVIASYNLDSQNWIVEPQNLGALPLRSVIK